MVPIVKNAFHDNNWYFVGNGLEVGVQEYDHVTGFLTKFAQSDICHSTSSLAGVVDTQSEFDELSFDATVLFTLTSLVWTEISVTVTNLDLNSFDVTQPCEVQLFWSEYLPDLDLEQGDSGHLTGPYCYDVLICVFNPITYSVVDLPTDFSYTSSNRRLTYGGSFVSGITDL